MDRDRAKEKRKIHGKALGCLGRKNQVRVMMNAIVKNDYFENFILFCILVSAVIIAADGSNTDKSTTLWKVLAKIDLSLVIVFTIEMILKWGALGLYCESPEAYFKD